MLCAGQSFAEPQEQATIVPFQFLRHEIVAQVRINGHGPFAMLLDTGTAPSVIDLKVAKIAGLKLDPVGHSGDGGGTKDGLAYETALPTVGIGPFKATDVSCLAMDLSALSRSFGRPIQGALGDSLFTDRLVQFDYHARVVRFYARSPFARQARRTNRPNYVTLPFRHLDCVQLNGVRVDGEPVRANLDTGSNSGFQLTPAAIRRLGLERVAARAKVKSQAGFNGAYGSRTGTVREVQVGMFTAHSPPMTFWSPGTGHDKEPWDMNIGNLFLQDFVVTIDYRANTVTFERP